MSASKTVDFGYVEECCVASTMENNRFSIVWVFQASDDIQFPYSALLGGVIPLAVLEITAYFYLRFNTINDFMQKTT